MIQSKYATYYSFRFIISLVLLMNCTTPPAIPQRDKYGRTKEQVRRYSIAETEPIINIINKLIKDRLALQSIDSTFIVSDHDIKSFIDKIFNINRQQLFNSTDFRYDTFKEEISCVDTSFNARMDFSYAKFKKHLNLRVTFLNEIQFRHTEFNNGVSFSLSKAKENAYFNNVRFNGNTHFDYMSFDGFAIFDDSFFNERCDFSSVSFNDFASFEGVSIIKDLNFNATHFSHTAYFSRLKLRSSASLNFKDCVLPNVIDFSFNNKLPNTIDLTNASFSDSLHYNKKTDKYYSPHYINLYKSDIGKFKLDYIHFRLFNDSIKDPNHSDKFFMIPQDEMEGIYEALLNNFKTNGQMTSYKLLDIEYQQYKWKNSLTPFFGLLAQYWWNFGYNKEFILLWTVLLLFLFTLITFCFLDYLNKTYEVKKLGTIPSLSSKRFTVRDSLKRTWFAFVYTSIIFFRLTLKVEDINYRKVPSTIYIILMYTVGIICIAYMANYIITR